MLESLYTEAIKKKGTIHDKIKEYEISNYNISIPSLSEQTKIADFLSAIDDKIAQTATQIEKMEAWKKGLLQQLFV